jgi:hypothetical protein
MSILAAKLDEIRTAAAIAKKLSPAMQKAMTAPTFALDVVGKPHVVEGEDGALALRNVRVGTVCALIDRELVNTLQYDEGGMTKSNSFTELGLLVRDVFLRGADVMLEEGRQAAATEVAEGLSDGLRDTLLTTPDESGLRLAPLGTRGFLERQGLATFYTAGWFSLTDFGILVWRVLSARATRIAECEAALRQVGTELDGAKIDLPVTTCADTECVSSGRALLCDTHGPELIRAALKHNNPHDYEPGDITHPMATDPDCRICGSTRRDCERRQGEQDRITEVAFEQTAAEDGADVAELIAKDLTPAMREVMRHGQRYEDLSYVPAALLGIGSNTFKALATRELLRPITVHNGMRVYPLTDLGAEVTGYLREEMKVARDGVSEQGPEEPAVCPGVKATQTPVEVLPLVADMPRRTVELHLALARVADRQYRESGTAGPMWRRDVHTALPPAEVAMVNQFVGLGWVERHNTVIVPGATMRLTDLGMKALMVWDGAYARNDFPQVPVANVGTFANPLAEGVPPREVLVAMPTKAVVQKYSEYYLLGPGRYFADQVNCEHDYRLIDSCPCC